MDEDDSEVYDDVVDAADSADESLLSSEAFQPSEWINCGKVWADPMPSHVVRALKGCSGNPHGGLCCHIPSRRRNYRHPAHTS